MEALSKFISQTGGKFAIYFLYISAQILVLASLLLTTTDVAVHVFVMLLTVGFYFATALKNPGFYQGVVEPNHEDVTQPQIKVTKQKVVERQWQSQMQLPADQIKQTAQGISKTSIEDRQGKAGIDEQSTVLKNQNKSKLSNVSAQYQAMAAALALQEANKQLEMQQQGQKQLKKDILNLAKSVFKFALFRSKKELQSKAALKTLNKTALQTDDKIQPKQNEQIPNQLLEVPFEYNDNLLRKNTGKPKRARSMLDKDDFAEVQIHPNLTAAVNVAEQLKQNKKKTITETLNEMKRYCRLCEIYQPLRVRHCHSCDRCVGTFDHHCPWMANCIGQKNKFEFIVYLLLQTVQLLTIIADLVHFLSGNELVNQESICILLVSVVLIFVLIVLLLSFHLYLIAKNITTWQLIHWEKIEYLKIFDKKKISSPFDKGLVQNVNTFWRCSMVPELQTWIKDVDQDLSKYLLPTKEQTKLQADTMESDRRPFNSQKFLRN